jgi:hypothetical protein
MKIKNSIHMASGRSPPFTVTRLKIVYQCINVLPKKSRYKYVKITNVNNINMYSFPRRVGGTQDPALTNGNRESSLALGMSRITPFIPLSITILCVVPQFNLLKPSGNFTYDQV